VPNRWSWLALGVGAYLAFTISKFPATTAYAWFAPEGVVALTGIEGTVWSGGAAAGSVAGLAVNDLRWRMRPWALLTGRVGANLEARLADGFVSANATASPSRVRLRDVRGSTSLPTLAGLLPVRGMRGQANIALSELELEDGWPTAIVGELRLAALEVAPLVSTGGGQLFELGDYTVRFTEAADRGIAASFGDGGGPFEVTGTVALDANRNYMLDALVEPRPGAPQELVDGLALMTAEPDPEGRRRLMLTGSL
jgi:general secretion pathway protein N